VLSAAAYRSRFAIDNRRRSVIRKSTLALLTFLLALAVSAAAQEAKQDRLAPLVH
jgi:hypothetical protein